MTSHKEEPKWFPGRLKVNDLSSISLVFSNVVCLGGGIRAKDATVNEYAHEKRARSFIISKLVTLKEVAEPTIVGNCRGPTAEL